MKRRLIQIVLLFFLGLTNQTVNAQPSEPGYPAALIYQLPTTDLPVVNLPYFNNEELIAADTCASCGEAFGIDAMAEFDFWQQSQLEVINNDYEYVEIYRVKIKSPTANALHVIFEHFELGANSLIYFYSPDDTSRILGAYSMHNNKEDLSFVSNRIFDNEIIIEVNRRPKSAGEPQGVLTVKKFIHVYKSRTEFEESLSCHENVICAPWYNEWCNQIRSAVKLYRKKANDKRWWMCSGALINNLNGDFDPLILTANHCVEDGAEHATWMVFFNFQSITCNPTTNGNDLMTVTGVDVIATDYDRNGCPDIALLRLREAIPLQYNVFYSGWNRRAWSSLPDDDRAVGIHHPAGDVKKISEGYRKNPLLSSCVKVNWTTGYTEGGSSGSPLFVTSKEIIGVLSWGWHEEDDCDHDANFFYSWLHKSWGTLSPYLAPGNEGALTHTGIDPISACQPVLDLNRRFFPGNDWQIKNQITIQAAQQVNVANITETVIGNSDIFHFTPQHNSDYIIRAGKKISIYPGFKINVQTYHPVTGIFGFHDGNQNRVSFQISPCIPYIENCGINHENSFTSPFNRVEKGGDVNTQLQQPNKNAGFSLYPNPNSGTFTISIPSDEPKHILIYDRLGNLVSSTTSVERNIVLTINPLNKGVYFVRIMVSARHYTTKLIVE